MTLPRFPSSALYFPRVQAGCACRTDNCILMSSSGNPSTGWLCITVIYSTQYQNIIEEEEEVEELEDQHEREKQQEQVQEQKKEQEQD